MSATLGAEKLVSPIARSLIYFIAGMITCSKCNQASKIIRLVKCPVCFKPVCDECAVRRYAQKFCSEDCARSFFFGTGEEYVDEQ